MGNETEQTLQDLICKAIEKVSTEITRNAYYKTSCGYQSKTKRIWEHLIEARELIEERSNRE
jgi:hypothetical protein